MPKIVDQWVKKVMKKWKSKDQSYWIIIASLTKAWILDKKWNLTPLWKKRNSMTESARHKVPVSKTKLTLKKKPTKKK